MIALDTSAIVAILGSEAEAVALGRCLARSARSAIATPTFVEAAIVLTARHGNSGRERLDTLLTNVNARKVDFDDRLADLAIEAFSRFGRGSGHRAKLNLGDCFSYALAKSLDAPLLYKGDDFAHTDIRSALDA